MTVPAFIAALNLCLLRRPHQSTNLIGILTHCATGIFQVLHYANSRVLVATRKHECRPKENCAGILGQTKADLSVNVNPFEVSGLNVHPVDFLRRATLYVCAWF